MTSTPVRWALTLVLGFVFSISRHALAADHYVSDCQAGADDDCVAGDDSNAGTSPSKPWRTLAQANAAFASFAAGDRILFARGGSFSGDEHEWTNASCKVAEPCVLADYDPPWASGDEGRPILSSAGTRFFHFVAGSGYEMRNLELRGLGDGTTWAIIVEAGIDGLVVDNLVIQNFAIGFYGGHPAPSHVTFSNSRVLHNRTFGWFGGANQSLIEDNYFEDNGTEAIFDHNIYFSYATDTVIRGNELYKSDMGGTGQCRGTSLVVHGQSQRITVEGNYVHEDVGAAEGGCWGIALVPGYSSAEDFSGSIIRGNRVVNVGNLAIGASSCPDCVIENNVIVQEQAYGADGIRVPTAPRDPEDVADDHATVRNNSIYMNPGPGGSKGIVVGKEGGAHVVVGNIVSYTGSSSDFFCFELSLPPDSYEAVDNNICSFSGRGYWEYSTFSTLAEWQAATSLDQASSVADPLFVHASAPDYDLSIAEGSPAIDAGHATLSSKTDFDGHPRDAKPDIGAFEYGSSPPDGSGGGSAGSGGASSGAGAGGDGGGSSESSGGSSNSGGGGGGDAGCSCRAGGDGLADTRWFWALAALPLLRRRKPH